MDVVVIGGGVVGLSVTESLARRGADVVLVEAGEWGAGASAGNAGWVSPVLSGPVPAPGIMGQALRWMPNPRSPLRVRPTLRPSFLRWSVHFWRATRQDRYGAGMAALVALGAGVMEDYERLAADGVAFESYSTGLLFVARTAGGLRAERQLLRDVQALGYGGGVHELSRAETFDFEPALAGTVAGAAYTPDERHVRPESVVRGFVDHLASGRADLRSRTAARAVTPERGRWKVEIDGGDGPLCADAVVVATGWQSEALLAPLGVRLPLEGGKGYSVTVDDPPAVPRRPLYLLEDRVAVSPFDGALRLAGTMELGSTDPNVSPGRLGAVEAAGRRALVEWNGSGARAWAGFRPMLPDGLPAIGPVPGRPGLYVATGHAMLGVTLGPTTGELLATTVLDRRPSLELAPFSPARFGNRPARP